MPDYKKIREVERKMYELVSYIEENKDDLTIDEPIKNEPFEVIQKNISPIFKFFFDREKEIFSISIKGYTPRSFRNNKLAFYEKKLLYKLLTQALDNFEKQEGNLPMWKEVFVLAYMKEQKENVLPDPQNYSFLPLFDPLENRLIPADNGNVIKQLLIKIREGEEIETALTIIPYKNKEMMKEFI